MQKNERGPGPPAAEGSVDAILMASGFSHRFGAQNKLLQLYKGKPLVWYPLQLASGLGQLRNIWFVYADEAVAQVAAPFPVRLIRNERPLRGACESIRLGVAASQADYYLFMPCDQPLLDTATVERILAARRPGGIVQPVSEGQPGSPSLFAKEYREALLALGDGENARDIKLQNRARLRDVPVQNPAVLADVDTPEALERLERVATAKDENFSDND